MPKTRNDKWVCSNCGQPYHGLSACKVLPEPRQTTRAIMPTPERITVLMDYEVNAIRAACNAALGAGRIEPHHRSVLIGLLNRAQVELSTVDIPAQETK